MAGRVVHYGLEDLDAAAIRLRAPRRFTQEISRSVYERTSADGERAYAGFLYLSRLGDELRNWAIWSSGESSRSIASGWYVCDGRSSLPPPTQKLLRRGPSDGPGQALPTGVARASSCAPISWGGVPGLPITLLLCEAGLLREPLLTLSLYLRQNRDTHYAHLGAVRRDGDFEAWLVFLLEGVRETDARSPRRIDRSRCSGTTGRESSPAADAPARRCACTRR